MQIDNFNQIHNLIKADDSEFLYEAQIIRRGKDHPELPAANQLIKTLCIHGKEDLLKHYDEIVKLCEMFEARAYFSLQRKSNKKCIENAIKCYADRLYIGDTKRPEAIWWHAVGTTIPEKKLWVVDVDSKDLDLVSKIISYIEKQQPFKNPVGVVPTLNGFHIISHPFNCSNFSNDISGDVEIKKHGLTLLYM